MEHKQLTTGVHLELYFELDETEEGRLPRGNATGTLTGIPHPMDQSDTFLTDCRVSGNVAPEKVMRTLFDDLMRRVDLMRKLAKREDCQTQYNDVRAYREARRQDLKEVHDGA